MKRVLGFISCVGLLGLGIGTAAMQDPRTSGESLDSAAAEMRDPRVSRHRRLRRNRSGKTLTRDGSRRWGPARPAL
jgi:hypothetical protein